MSERHGLPPHVFTDDPSNWDAQSRIQVDVSQTGFWLGYQNRISYEYNVPNATTTVLRFTSATNFIIQFESLTCDVGAIRFRAFRSGEGTPGGTFGTPVTISRVNAMSVAPDYVSQVSIARGGTFTPTPGVDARETIRLRVSNATGQQTSVSGSAADERGLPADTYYLLLENIASSGATQGVFDLRWEERPADINAWLRAEFGEYD